MGESIEEQKVHCMECGGGGCLVCDGTLDDAMAAKAERDRLAAENAALRQALDDTGPLIMARDDEIAALRAKLERVRHVAENRASDCVGYSRGIVCAAELEAALDGGGEMGEGGDDE